MKYLATMQDVEFLVEAEDIRKARIAAINIIRRDAPVCIRKNLGDGMKPFYGLKLTLVEETSFDDIEQVDEEPGRYSGVWAGCAAMIFVGVLTSLTVWVALRLFVE